MSFLDKILEGDVDEKAVSVMQQSLESDLFTSQSTMVQSYIPPPSTITSYDTVKSDPPSFNVIPRRNEPLKPEPSPISPYSQIKQEQPTYHVMQSSVIKPEPPARITASGVPMIMSHSSAASILPTPANIGMAGGTQPTILSTVQPLHAQPYTSMATGATPTIVPTAVITQQRVNTTMVPPQVIAVSSVQMAGGPFAVYTAPSSSHSQPQTIMVSAPHTSTPQIVTGVRPSLMSQPIRTIQSKPGPMVVPIQPLNIAVKGQQMPLTSTPIPIQPAIRPPPGPPQSHKSEQKTAAILSSLSTRESVQKLKAFLTNLLNISNKQDQATGQTVKDLIGKVMTATIDEETFLNELQVALKSPPQPHLLVFLKQSVPVLRNEMQNRQRAVPPLPGSKMQGAPPQPPGVNHTPFPGLAPVQTSKIIPMSVPPQSIGHQFGSGPIPSGTHYHPAPTFSAPQRTFADKHRKKYTLSKDDTEINDVTSMAGVNLHEEAAKISTLEHVTQEQRNTHDTTMVPSESLSSKISRLCDRHGVTTCAVDVKELLSHALEARMKNLLEKLVSINHHRLDLRKQDQENQVVMVGNVRGQLKVLQQIQVEEGRRRHEREKAQLIKEAKSRSKQTNSEAKAKAKQVAMEEEQLLRQREANETALAAIGARKRPKAPDYNDGNMPLQNPRTRSHRVNIKDLMFLCQSDLWLRHSQLLLKLHVK